MVSDLRAETAEAVAHMANAALFLCSPAAGWVSGQILTVSGGGVQELD